MDVRLGSSDPPEAKPEDEQDNLSDFSEGFPAFSPEGSIRWFYERCDQQQDNAIMVQDPQKVHKYEFRKNSLRDLMKHMTTAGNEDWDEVVDVLDHISDASSDEDSPAMNTSGGR